MNRRIAILVGLAVVLTGCTPVAIDAEPPELTVALYQHRAGIAAGILEIQLANEGTAPVTVSRAVLDSTGFSAPMIWERRHSTVLPGRRLDLPVEIGEVRCDIDGPPEHIVTLTILDSDGSANPIEHDAFEPFGQLALLHRERCLARELQGIAELEITSIVLPSDTAGPVILEISTTPGEREGSFVVDSLLGTTLFAPAGDDGRALDRRALEMTIRSSDAARTIPIPLVPSRCDEHAVLEDKLGTVFPFVVADAGGEQGRLLLAAPESVRHELYRYIAAACGFREG